VSAAKRKLPTASDVLRLKGAYQAASSLLPSGSDNTDNLSLSTPIKCGEGHRFFVEFRVDKNTCSWPGTPTVDPKGESPIAEDGGAHNKHEGGLAPCIEEQAAYGEKDVSCLPALAKYDVVTKQHAWQEREYED
jgi:hypothetical protein